MSNEESITVLDASEISKLENELKPRQIQPMVNREVLVSDKGVLEAKTIEGQFRIAAMAFNAGLVPKGFTNAEQVMAGMQFAVEFGLPPLSGLRYIAVINGQPSIWGDLPLALCRKSGLLAKIEEKILDKDLNEICLNNKNLTAEPFAGWCRITRHCEEPREFFFSTEDAKKADLLGKNTPWKTHTRRMLQMRPRQQGLKDVFPEILANIGIAEYDYNTIPKAGIMKDVGHDGVQKIDLNEL